MHRWKAVAQRQDINAIPVGNNEVALADIQPVCTAVEPSKREVKLVGLLDFHCGDFEAKRLGRFLDFTQLQSGRRIASIVLELPIDGD